MSDNWLVLIPTDPLWQPTQAETDQVMIAVGELAPDASEVSVIYTEEVEFIDAGENFESVACPHCGTEVSDWWSGAMDEAFGTRFANLRVTMPCCGRPSSLNELRYDMPQGFARFSVSIAEPELRSVTPDDLARVGNALGHAVRAIWRHI